MNSSFAAWFSSYSRVTNCAIAGIALLLVNGCKEDSVNRTEYIRNVTVVFNAQTPQDTINAIILGGGFQVVSSYPDSSVRMYNLDLPDGMNYDGAVTYLKGFSWVESVAPCIETKNNITG